MTESLIYNWDEMSSDDLIYQITNVIMGQGMGGSTQYIHFKSECFDKISDVELKNKIYKVLSELLLNMDNPVSSRVVYISGELNIPNLSAIVLGITNKIDEILDKIICVDTVPDSYMRYLDYICEINKIIAKYHITEAEQFLVKQLKQLRRPAPLPPSNEFYVYHLCARSALESLKLLNPELTKEYV